VDTVRMNDHANALLDLFAKDEVGLVVDDEGTLRGIITKMDLVDHLTSVVSA
jgi:CBS-domain-containing membrane protein